MVIFKTFSFYLLLIQTLLITAAHSPFNISHFIPPISSELLLPPPFLQLVLRAVSLRQGWNRTDEVKVSKLDTTNASIGSSMRYEFRVGDRKTQLVFKMIDDVAQWKKMVEVEQEKDFELAVKEIGSVAMVGDFRIEGPLELVMRRDHKLSLQLPQNTSHDGLTRILVPDGVSLEVKNAQEVSLFFPLKLGENESHKQKKRGYFSPFQHPSCQSLLPLHLSGSAKVTAFRTRNPDSYIHTKLLSRNTIELLPEKCYLGNNHERRGYHIDSLSTRINLMEKLLRSIKVYNNNGTFGFLRADIRASNVVWFRIEVERKIRKEEGKKSSEWRTRPSVERFWFEVMARIEGGKLKPVKIRKIRPFIEADSSSWSNIMSNISFTNFPSFLVPPEDLTLDVKW